jgi:cyanophycinase
MWERDLYVYSRSAGAILSLPATASYPEVSQQRVAARQAVDLTAWRRARLERAAPAFPGLQSPAPRLAGGSLVIVGGGGATPEIWQTFVDLAGGREAQIVVLPTAVPDPTSDSGEARIFRRFGAERIRVLPQVDREAVSSAAFLDELRSATGVWFGGGRQWRFVDAYWGTPAWDEIINVVRRGGVIGGSSAGATIQGDLLVRGHPLGNQIMIADGYRHGLGLLPGVAIDQHFSQRNRFAELAGCLQPYPQILGVGIDEATALVVEAPSRARVIGSGSVWVLPRTDASDTQRDFLQFPAGQTFDLEALKP